MKIRQNNQKPLQPILGRKGQPAFVEADPQRNTIVILSKDAEPRAIFSAWTRLPDDYLHDPNVASVMHSLVQGRDPFLYAMKGFISACEQAEVEVIVHARNAKPRPLRIEKEGSCYTEKDSPIQRKVGESVEDYYLRWNNHRSGLFSLIAHEWLAEHGKTLDSFVMEDRSALAQNAVESVTTLIRNEVDAERHAQRQSRRNNVEAAPEVKPVPVVDQRPLMERLDRIEKMLAPKPTGMTDVVGDTLIELLRLQTEFAAELTETKSILAKLLKTEPKSNVVQFPVQRRTTPPINYADAYTFIPVATTNETAAA